jgi:hypothetical protein
MNEQPKKISNSVWAGAIILAIGSVLLLTELDLFYFPQWLFSPGSFLIALGLIIGVNKNFQGVGWFILILIGGFWVLSDIPDMPYEFRNYRFPLALIVVGAFIVGRSLLGGAAREARKKNGMKGDGIITLDGGDDDYFDMTAVFGGAKRKVFSKSFKGGQSFCIFGGTEIDLSQADINGNVVIDTVQLFGGTKIIIPANWQLKSDITAVLGGVDDKRSVPTSFSPEKKIVLTGFAMFGGVEIKSH